MEHRARRRRRVDALLIVLFMQFIMGCRQITDVLQNFCILLGCRHITTMVVGVESGWLPCS